MNRNMVILGLVTLVFSIGLGVGLYTRNTVTDKVEAQNKAATEYCDAVFLYAKTVHNLVILSTKVK